MDTRQKETHMYVHTHMHTHINEELAYAKYWVLLIVKCIQIKTMRYF